MKSCNVVFAWNTWLLLTLHHFLSYVYFNVIKKRNRTQCFIYSRSRTYNIIIRGMFYTAHKVIRQSGHGYISHSVGYMKSISPHCGWKNMKICKHKIKHCTPTSKHKIFIYISVWSSIIIENWSKWCLIFDDRLLFYIIDYNRTISSVKF